MRRWLASPAARMPSPRPWIGPTAAGRTGRCTAHLRRRAGARAAHRRGQPVAGAGQGARLPGTVGAAGGARHPARARHAAARGRLSRHARGAVPGPLRLPARGAHGSHGAGPAGPGRGDGGPTAGLRQGRRRHPHHGSGPRAHGSRHPGAPGAQSPRLHGEQRGLHGGLRGQAQARGLRGRGERLQATAVRLRLVHPGRRAGDQCAKLRERMQHANPAPPKT